MIRTANIAVSLQRLSILRIEHPQANPLTLACTLRAGESLPSGLTITAEIHTSRNVAAETAPLASSSVAVAADATSFDVSFTSAQLNQTVTPDSTRALWLVVYGVGDADQLYTLAAADLLLGWHAISALTADPPATSILVEKGGVAWVTGRTYAAGTVVTVGTTAYVCTTDNTSATDDEPGVGAEWGSFWVVLSGGGGGSTNLAAVPSPTNVVVTSDMGTDATIPAADGTNAGLMLPAEKAKLEGIATGATANATDAQLRARSSHTGTQAIATIDGLDTALSLKADLSAGKIPVSQIPAIAISEFLGPVASQAAMLALNGERGDWCTRTDLGKAFIITAEPSSLIANWMEWIYPVSPVMSVAGKNGAVTLSTGDLTDASAVGIALFTALTVAAQRSALGLGALSTLATVGNAQIDNGAVSNAKLAAMAAATLKGSVAGGTPADLNGTQVTTLLDTFTTSLKGLVPPSGGGTINFLRADGTWAAPPGGSVDLSSPGPIGGTTPNTGVYTQLDVRTELDVQSTVGAAGPVLIWNTPTTEVTNWERARLQWSSNVFIVGTELNGLGTPRSMALQTGGATRILIGSSGLIAINGATAPANTPLSVKAVNPGGNHVVVRVENAVNTSSIVEIGGTTSNNGNIRVISSSAGTVDIQAGNSQFPGNVGIGRGTGGDLTAARLHVKGTGTGTGLVLRLDDSGGAQRFAVQDNGGVVLGAPIILATFTVSTVPSASLWTRGLIYVSDEGGGSIPAFTDGTNWRRVSDRAVVSTTPS